ncbi:MAG: hypothetical protein K0U52_06280 [Gammaproteobacteria bacterium]|nr:hypothetical protein [Gammaproteobacteria bacterium]
MYEFQAGLQTSLDEHGDCRPLCILRQDHHAPVEVMEDIAGQSYEHMCFRVRHKRTPWWPWSAYSKWTVIDASKK